MEITIDENSGFCFGVTSAIERAEKELEHGPLYCLGDIVHNGQEVERLEKMGLTTIDYDDLRTLRSGRVLLRAHGEPPQTYRIAEDNGLTIIDATCPVVHQLQQRILHTYLQEHCTIVIYGQKGHAEVIGLQGQTMGTALIIEHAEEAQQLDFEHDIHLFSQTTKAEEDFNHIAQFIEQRMQNGARLYVHNTICRNVANRVARLQDFARAQDMILFVGGKKSSNAKVLFQHCLQANPRSYFISDEKDLDMSFDGVQKVGICGATSTPKWLMERVRDAIRLKAPEAPATCRP